MNENGERSVRRAFPRRVEDLLLSVRFHANMVPILVIGVLLYLFSQRAMASDAGQQLSLIVFVFFSGMVGGISNTYMRLQSMPVEAPGQSRLARIIAISQVYATPMVSGAFAVVAQALFASGLLSGSLFPTFMDGSAEYQGLNQMFTHYRPATQADAAKMIVWGFIAGFSEKMIPNILDRLAEEGKDVSNKDRTS